MLTGVIGTTLLATGVFSPFGAMLDGVALYLVTAGVSIAAGAAVAGAASAVVYKATEETPLQFSQSDQLLANGTENKSTYGAITTKTNSPDTVMEMIEEEIELIQKAQTESQSRPTSNTHFNIMQEATSSGEELNANEEVTSSDDDEKLPLLSTRPKNNY